MRVGFLGLGRMGRPMAANLAAAGFDLVVWNRTRAKADAFAAEHRAEVAATPAEAARGADAVVGMLADDTAVRESWLGDDGALRELGGGAVGIDASTISPQLAGELHRAAAATGTRFLDVPVSGSTDAAAAATLTLMVGGDADVLERVRPLLETLGEPVLHLGPAGAGAAMKLAVNGVVHSLNQAVGEALALAAGAGIAPEVAYDVLERSAVAAPMLGYRKRQYLDAADAPVSFALRLARKDVALALQLAERVGTELPQTRANLAALDAAVAAGYGDSDMGEIARWLRDLPPTRDAASASGESNEGANEESA